MQKSTVAAIVLFIVSVVLAIAGIIIMPEMVTLQLSLGGEQLPEMHKALALLVPTALGAGCSAYYYFSKKQVERLSKYMVFSVAGIFFLISLIVSNLP